MILQMFNLFIIGVIYVILGLGLFSYCAHKGYIHEDDLDLLSILYVTGMIYYFIIIILIFFGE